MRDGISGRVHKRKRMFSSQQECDFVYGRVRKRWSNIEKKTFCLLYDTAKERDAIKRATLAYKKKIQKQNE